MKLHWLLAPLFALLFGTGAQAVEVRGLYEGRVPVSVQSESARQAGTRAALAQVFVKVTGRPETAAAPALAPALEQADSLAQRFGYSGGRPGEPLELVVGFDAAAVDALLRQAGESFWASDRPATLVWVALESPPDPPRLVGSHDPSEATALIARQARARGVPMLFPLLDLREQAEVTPEMIAGGEELALIVAAQRYLTEEVASVYLRQTAEGWSARWTLHDETATELWESSGPTLAPVLESGVNTLADLLAAEARSRPSVVNLPEGRLAVRVRGVYGFDDYARLRAYLDSLSSVRAVVLREAAEDTLVFELTARGGPLGVAEAFGRGQLLRPADDGAMDTYVLMPQLFRP